MSFNWICHPSITYNPVCSRHRRALKCPTTKDLALDHPRCILCQVPGSHQATGGGRYPARVDYPGKTLIETRLGRQLNGNDAPIGPHRQLCSPVPAISNPPMLSYSVSTLKICVAVSLSHWQDLCSQLTSRRTQLKTLTADEKNDTHLKTTKTSYEPFFCPPEDGASKFALRVTWLELSQLCMSGASQLLLLLPCHHDNPPRQGPGNLLLQIQCLSPAFVWGSLSRGEP